MLFRRFRSLLSERRSRVATRVRGARLDDERHRKKAQVCQPPASSWIQYLRHEGHAYCNMTKESNLGVASAVHYMLRLFQIKPHVTNKRSEVQQVSTHWCRYTLPYHKKTYREHSLQPEKLNPRLAGSGVVFFWTQVVEILHFRSVSTRVCWGSWSGSGFSRLRTRTSIPWCSA